MKEQVLYLSQVSMSGFTKLWILIWTFWVEVPFGDSFQKKSLKFYVEPISGIYFEISENNYGQNHEEDRYISGNDKCWSGQLRQRTLWVAKGEREKEKRWLKRRNRTSWGEWGKLPKGGSTYQWDQRVIKETANVPCDVTIPGMLEISLKAVLRKALGFLMSWTFNTGQDKT